MFPCLPLLPGFSSPAFLSDLPKEASIWFRILEAAFTIV
jgi:hypothetical protein